MPIDLAAAGRAGLRRSNDRPADSAEIRRHLIETLDSTCDVLGMARWSASRSGDDELDRYTETVIGKLFEHLASGQVHGAAGAVVAQLAVQLERLRGELRLASTERRVNELSAARIGSRLLPANLPPLALLDRAAAAVCEACGLDRAMVFHVDDGHLVAAGTYFTDNSDWAAQSLQHAGETTVDLAPGRLETEMVRQRRAALMLDPQQDPNAFKPIVSFIRTSSYVAVPVEVNGQPFATVHVDAYNQARDVDQTDRDMVASFSEALANALERSIAIEELRQHRASLRDLLDRSDAGLFTAASVSRRDAGTDLSAGIEDTSPNRLMGALTSREMEILELLATGATNAAIAAHLVVAESTIKSHVKRILRKLRATNRGQAAAMYVRWSGNR